MQPMIEHDVSIVSGALELRGTLAMGGSPSGRAALLIGGSGPIDRDSNTKRLPLDIMHQVAHHLTAAGVISLRYDKRGVGDSDGDYLATGFHDNIADARAALDFLRAQPGVDADEVFVVGHSEGALIASALAVNEDLAGVVLLAGAAQNGKQVLRWQASQVAPTLPGAVQWLLKLLRQDMIQTQAKRLEQIEASTDDVIRIQFVKLNAKWFREFMSYEPAEDLRRATVPILAITGNKDIQVDPDDVGVMDEIVPTPFTGHVLEDVTHLLRFEAGPASVRTYKKQVSRPVDDPVLRLTADWIAAQAHAVNGADHDRV